MDNIELLLNDIVNEFLNLDIVKEYKRLDKEIENKYAKEILYFNSAKEKYEEESKYGEVSKETKEYLIRTKEKLFSFEEVKRYKSLEIEISEMLNQMSNDLSKVISNKFKLKKIFEV